MPSKCLALEGGEGPVITILLFNLQVDLHFDKWICNELELIEMMDLRMSMNINDDSIYGMYHLFNMN